MQCGKERDQGAALELARVLSLYSLFFADFVFLTKHRFVSNIFIITDTVRNPNCQGVLCKNALSQRTRKDRRSETPNRGRY